MRKKRLFTVSWAPALVLTLILTACRQAEPIGDRGDDGWRVQGSATGGPRVGAQQGPYTPRP